MESLPTELLEEIVSENVLTAQDLNNIALVNRRFHQVACARLYRTGELSYAGATEKDALKVEAFSKNGKYQIWRILRNFVNLHSFTFIDTGSLSWDDFTCVLAHIITTHPYLKEFEIQRTLSKDDGRGGIPKARALISEGKIFCKLETFTLRLAKREEPKLISRTAVNHLIEILGRSTRSATSFTYAAEFQESPDIDEKVNGKDPEALSWEWDNLEELSLKLQSYRSYDPYLAHIQQKWSVSKDLHNIKRLTFRCRTNDFISHGSQTVYAPQVKTSITLQSICFNIKSFEQFVGGLQALPKLERVRISHGGGFLSWDPSTAKSDHPFIELANTVPSLKIIELTDPYYMTTILQAYQIVRTDIGEIKLKFMPIK
ncbi:hypothetical protein ABW19_dt0202554 [Dactylella cylindrospora]|nr:hypothetical protein ABW19_dt0202554 [Dactylella cylindrospora]